MTEKELRKQISDRLRRLEPHPETFDRMSEKLGIARSTLYHAWVGDRTISIWVLCQLARAYQVAPGYFLETLPSTVDLLANMRGATAEDIEHVNRYLLEQKELREFRKNRLK